MGASGPLDIGPPDADLNGAKPPADPAGASTFTASLTLGQANVAEREQ